MRCIIKRRLEGMEVESVTFEGKYDNKFHPLPTKKEVKKEVKKEEDVEYKGKLLDELVFQYDIAMDGIFKEEETLNTIVGNFNRNMMVCINQLTAGETNRYLKEKFSIHNIQKILTEIRRYFFI